MDTPTEYSLLRRVPPAAATYALKANEGAQTGSPEIRVDRLASAQSSVSRASTPGPRRSAPARSRSTVGGSPDRRHHGRDNDDLTRSPSPSTRWPGSRRTSSTPARPSGDTSSIVTADETGAVNAVSFDGPACRDDPGVHQQRRTPRTPIDLAGITLTSSTNKFDAALPGIEMTSSVVRPPRRSPFRRRCGDAAQAACTVIDAYNERPHLPGHPDDVQPGSRDPRPLFGEATTRGAVDDVSTRS